MKKPWDIPAGSQGCSGVGKGYARKRKSQGQGGKILLAVVTLCNVALSLALALLRRQEVIHAVKGKDGEEVHLLLTSRKETKT